MKITKSQLQKIIEEETKKVLLEQAGVIPDSEDPWAWMETAEHDPAHQQTSWGEPTETDQPTEQDYEYFQHLARLEGGDPRYAALDPSEQLSLISIPGQPPIYDPKYIPPYRQKPYLRGQKEEYVHLAPMSAQEIDWHSPLDDYIDEAMAMKDPSPHMLALQKELADAKYFYNFWKGAPEHSMRAEPAFLEAARSIKRLEKEIAATNIFEREAERAKTLADWDMDTESHDPKIASSGGPLQFDAVNTPGGRQRFFGTPQMKEYLKRLTKIGSGEWYIGDISKKGGGNISHHGSHESGIDVDIALPVLGGGMSVEDAPFGEHGGGGTKLRRLSTNELDYDAALDFLRKTAPYAKSVFLDKKFEPGLKAKAKALIQSGEMSKTEYIRLFAMLGHEKHHADHFHVRLRGVYPEERGLGQRGMGRQPLTPPGRRGVTPPERARR